MLPGPPPLSWPLCWPRSPRSLSFPPGRRFKAVSAKSKEDLVSQGFTEFTIEDFHNTVSLSAGWRAGGLAEAASAHLLPHLLSVPLGWQFMDLIEQVEKQTSVADLLASFNDQSTSDYLVVYLRLLTSGYLQRESKFFEHFIEGGRTVKEFCQQVLPPPRSPDSLGPQGGSLGPRGCTGWLGVRRRQDPGPERPLCCRRWSPCARRATTSTSSRWPRRSASKCRLGSFLEVGRKSWAALARDTSPKAARKRREGNPGPK